MTDDTVINLVQPGSFEDRLTEVLRNGARALAAQAVEPDMAALLGCHADLRTRGRPCSHRASSPERELLTGLGRWPFASRGFAIEARRPAIRSAIRFSSTLLPP